MFIDATTQLLDLTALREFYQQVYTKLYGRYSDDHDKLADNISLSFDEVIDVLPEYLQASAIAEARQYRYLTKQERFDKANPPIEKPAPINYLAYPTWKAS